MTHTSQNDLIIVISNLLIYTMIHNYYCTICKYFEALQFNNDPFKNDSFILIKHKSPFLLKIVLTFNKYVKTKYVKPTNTFNPRRD